MPTFLLAAATAACGGSDNPSGPGSDASPTAARCSATAPFTTIVRVADLSTEQRDPSVRLSADELTAYVTRRPAVDAPPYREIHVATRPNTGVPFGAPVPLSTFNTSAAEGHPSVTSDHRSLFVEYAATESGPFRIFVSTRSSTAAAFGASLSIPSLPEEATHPFVIGNAAALYMARTVGGNQDLYRAAGRGDGSFTAPAVLEAVNGPAYEAMPVASPDETVLYFARNSGPGGDIDIWVATRSGPSVPFSTPAVVNELNSGAEDVPSWISSDLCRMYFASARPGGAGSLDIYLATRPPS